MFEELDWSRRGDYMLRRHGVSPFIAEDALADPSRIVISPDYNSKTGRTTRIIGYSALAEKLFTVIVIEDAGIEYGVNGWVSNSKDHRLYYQGGRYEPH